MKLNSTVTSKGQRVVDLETALSEEKTNLNEVKSQLEQRVIISIYFLTLCTTGVNCNNGKLSMQEQNCDIICAFSILKQLTLQDQHSSSLLVIISTLHYGNK